MASGNYNLEVEVASSDQIRKKEGLSSWKFNLIYFILDGDSRNWGFQAVFFSKRSERFHFYTIFLFSFPSFTKKSPRILIQPSGASSPAEPTTPTNSIYWRKVGSLLLK